MKSIYPYLTYALNEKGLLVHVDSVPNGNNCGCMCPNCKKPLCAKNGGKSNMIHHFAHQSGTECAGAIESALHKMAKDILCETKTVFLPKRWNGEEGKKLTFDRVEVEFYDKDTKLRPDCIGYHDDKVMWIEFKNTHAVDDKKRGKIIGKKIDCIEIDLKDCVLDYNKVKHFITNTPRERIWIRDISASNINIGTTFGSAQYKKDINLNFRTFAIDDEGNLVNVNDDEVNMNVHTYFCLSCGTEVVVDIDMDGYYFRHANTDIICNYYRYLYRAAKEILYNKFCNSNEFVICYDQFYKCELNKTCYNYKIHTCVAGKNVSYNLKKYGYTQAIKDYVFPNDLRCELLIKRGESIDNAIALFIDTGFGNNAKLVQQDAEGYFRFYSVNRFINKKEYRDILAQKQKIIHVSISDDYLLGHLRKEDLREGFVKFENFKKLSTKTLPKSEIKELLHLCNL